MEAYQPGQLTLVINPDAEPVPIPDVAILVRQRQLERKRPAAPEPEALPGSDEAKPIAAPKCKKAKNPFSEKHLTDERNDRTVFIGNVPTTSTAKTIRKLLDGKADIESVRFRSASFSQVNLPKRAAFIQGMFHDARSTMNCYVVLKDASSIDDVLELNGTQFKGHVIRVDRIAAEVQHDDSRCVFVGNLPFDVSEDDLWQFFQTCGPINYVRCIRDSRTNVGKGFAYVQFADQSAVKQALAFNDGLFKGRNLRVFRSGRQDNPALKRINKKLHKERHRNKPKTTYEGAHAVTPGKKSVGKKKKSAELGKESALTGNKSTGKKSVGKKSAGRGKK